jgi:hypothetical protein
MYMLHADQNYSIKLMNIQFAMNLAIISCNSTRI